jgi:hypothetical protein
LTLFGLAAWGTEWLRPLISFGHFHDFIYLSVCVCFTVMALPLAHTPKGMIKAGDSEPPTPSFERRPIPSHPSSHHHRIFHRIFLDMGTDISLPAGGEVYHKYVLRPLCFPHPSYHNAPLFPFPAEAEPS